MSKKTIAVALAAMSVFCTHLAFAQKAGYDEKRTDSGQDVVFKDADVLDASQFGSQGARIQVMPQPKRVLLLRPRTQFVTEMLKSVEAL
jgi:hypothetical protein